MTKKQMNPNSLKNLIPNSQRTHEQLSAMGKKGGKANGSKSVHWKLTIIQYETGWKLVCFSPQEAKEGIERALEKANFILHQELEKEFCALWKKKYGHKPRFL